MRAIQKGTGGGIRNIAWNHEQFSVSYTSLHDEVQVGGVYMRLWLGKYI